MLRVSHTVHNGRVAIFPVIGPLLFLDEPNVTYFKRYVTELVRAAILDQLADRMAQKTVDGKPPRKDVVGLHRYVDHGATTSCLGIKRRSPIPELSIPLFREILNIIISGSTMTNDRLFAAGLSETDKCSCCGSRHTMLHLYWHCKLLAYI